MFRSIHDRLIRKIAFVSLGEDSVPPELLRLHRFCGEDVHLHRVLQRRSSCFRLFPGTVWAKYRNET
jgi:hypothetical protein